MQYQREILMKNLNIDFFFHIYYYHKFKKMKNDDEFKNNPEIF